MERGESFQQVVLGQTDSHMSGEGRIETLTTLKAGEDVEHREWECDLVELLWKEGGQFLTQ